MEQISVKTDTEARIRRVMEAKLEELQESRKDMFDMHLDNYVAQIDSKIELIKELLSELDKPAS